MLHIYNTLSGKKEPLPLTKERVNMFVCGPTVYAEPHIGNARTFLNFDIIARYMRSRGYKMFYLQNITDVDDKIIAQASAENVTWKEVARRYENVYKKNLKALNIASVDKYARATDHIQEIVRQIQVLIKKDHAYLIPDDGWYFDLSTFPEYGKLSRRTAEQAEDATSRIDASDRKRNRGDFCLWKLTSPKPQNSKSEPVWKTPLGAGRPGWHIEDTAITEHFFGSQYDIHGGGVDLKFPHHEAEIAQQESASGEKPFVRVWMHSGFLTVDGRKMSKSLSNSLMLSHLLHQFEGDAFRMMALSSHYRSPLNYTWTLASIAAKNIVDVRAFLIRLKFVENNSTGDIQIPIESYEQKFHAAMEDDFNTPGALAAISSSINETNKNIWELAPKEARRLRLWLRGILEMLGFSQLDLKIPAKINRMAAKREAARRNQQFMQADDLRKEVEALGYSIEDTPLGPLILPLTPAPTNYKL